MRWLGALLFVVLLAGVARADDKEPKRRVIKLDEISVEGHIQKPQAFYILPRSSLNYKGLDTQETFLPKVSRALDQDPF